MGKVGEDGGCVWDGLGKMVGVWLVRVGEDDGCVVGWG